MTARAPAIRPGRRGRAAARGVGRSASAGARTPGGGCPGRGGRLPAAAPAPRAPDFSAGRGGGARGAAGRWQRGPRSHAVVERRAAAAAGAAARGPAGPAAAHAALAGSANAARAPRRGPRASRANGGAGPGERGATAARRLGAGARLRRPGLLHRPQHAPDVVDRPPRPDNKAIDLCRLCWG